jgi:nitrate reductase beta subunit
MVMDLNKCLGCQTCTMACKKLWTDRDGTQYMYWNNVETRPGLGYPRQWDQIGGGWKDGQLQPSRQLTLDDYGAPWEFDYEQRLFEGNKKPVMASPDPISGPNWDEDVGALNGEDNFYFYLPRICNHCTNPACLAACPRQAIYKREEDGIVVLDQERCEGYRYCVAACPYKKIYFNEIRGKSEKWKKATSMPVPRNAPAGCASSVCWTIRTQLCTSLYTSTR